MQYSLFPLWRRHVTVKFALVGLALMLLTSLAACGGSSTSGTPSSGGSTSSGPVNLTYWSWIPGMDKQVALFNQSHPKIHITLSNVGSGSVEYDKLFTAIKANNEPDISQVEFQTLPQFETTGSLVDLSQYGANSVKSQFPSWMWSQVSLGNGIYAIPQDGGPMALYYRADIFQKYNLPVPNNLGAVCRRRSEVACRKLERIYHGLSTSQSRLVRRICVAEWWEHVQHQWAVLESVH